MASVYILFSQKLDRFYIGSCNDLSYRIGQHLNKEFTNSFTAKANDWELYFFIDNLAHQQSRLIERHIKNMKSRQYITNIKMHPEIIDKLKQRHMK